MNVYKSLASRPAPSQPTKQATLWTSDPLTPSEIDSLRQGKKSIADFVQKAFPDREALLKVRKHKPTPTI